MKKMTICNAALEVLKQSKKPLEIQEIFDIIIKNKLFEFNSKTPLSVFRSTIRRHTSGIGNLYSNKAKYFQIVEGNKIWLL